MATPALACPQTLDQGPGPAPNPSSHPRDPGPDPGHPGHALALPRTPTPQLGSRSRPCPEHPTPHTGPRPRPCPELPPHTRDQGPSPTPNATPHTQDTGPGPAPNSHPTPGIKVPALPGTPHPTPGTQAPALPQTPTPHPGPRPRHCPERPTRDPGPSPVPNSRPTPETKVRAPKSQPHTQDPGPGPAQNSPPYTLRMVTTPNYSSILYLPLISLWKKRKPNKWFCRCYCSPGLIQWRRGWSLLQSITHSASTRFLKKPHHHPPAMRPSPAPRCLPRRIKSKFSCGKKTLHTLVPACLQPSPLCFLSCLILRHPYLPITLTFRAFLKVLRELMSLHLNKIQTLHSRLHS
ncbi:uncharacterized protein LOC104008075 [Pan troglodytes]|uniref:uncharacterized protein LOC104008075 n=1 Tax=Pan troglodytes TaxID=9598 RepID=UPI0023F1FDAA|nr:uncharacterized protein LOC104008075 [Pan troglodytes]XP_016818023.3 uncharacterized protein LOC104008075 [Pan troglodytes]